MDKCMKFKEKEGSKREVPDQKVAKGKMKNEDWAKIMNVIFGNPEVYASLTHQLKNHFGTDSKFFNPKVKSFLLRQKTKRYRRLSSQGMRYFSDPLSLTKKFSNSVKRKINISNFYKKASSTSLVQRKSINLKSEARSTVKDISVISI